MLVKPKQAKFVYSGVPFSYQKIYQGMKDMLKGRWPQYGKLPEMFIHLLKDRLSQPLPGPEAQIKMAPQSRISAISLDPPESAQVSSVLILLYPLDNHFFIPFILRTEYDGPHSGQIGLPGGKKEDRDQDLEQTAIREAKEETGIDVAAIEVLGKLTTLYIPPSNFLVHPVVAYTPVRPDFVPDPGEVQEIIEVSLEDIGNEKHIARKNLKLRSGAVMEVPGFHLGDHFIWGATAMILSEFIEILQEF